MVPETRYAKIRDRQVAYQVIGDGPIDMIVVPPAYLPIDLMWEEPAVARFIDRLSSFTRSIWFDSWGMGSSAPLPHDEARVLEAVVDDMVGLLDSVACERAAVFDVSGSWVSPLFAATHPERTLALVLHSP
ncbi:MAG: alpha/beta hydrolase, partial [Candidatus Dormibacteraeota bacterium]|nr:alpha/beta hydrolase [Candidatus Dormibacteraeota bacterium]